MNTKFMKLENWQYGWKMLILDSNKILSKTTIKLTYYEHIII